MWPFLQEGRNALTYFHLPKKWAHMVARDPYVFTCDDLFSDQIILPQLTV